MAIPELHRNTWAEIDSAAISDNTAAVKARLRRGVRLMAVVKADGYGHGDVESARAALGAGAEQLAVAYLGEALRLREHGIEAPILVLTPVSPSEAVLAIEHNLMLTVISASWLREISRYKLERTGGKLRLHVKMDTGLGRLGVRSQEEWKKMVPWLQRPHIELVGVYTHFATAGQEHTDYVERQLHRFRCMKQWVLQSGFSGVLYHCAGSAAALRFPGAQMDMVRIGAALFGFGPQGLDDGIQLKPALSLHSRMLQVKKLEQGEYIGYDNSYQASGQEWVATVPIGYADGWSQGLRGSMVLAGGMRMPVIGKICMDQLMIRLPHRFPEGTKVTLIGRQQQAEISCRELAQYVNSVPQEISSSLSARVERVYLPAAAEGPSSPPSFLVANAAH